MGSVPTDGGEVGAGDVGGIVAETSVSVGVAGGSVSTPPGVGAGVPMGAPVGDDVPVGSDAAQATSSPIATAQTKATRMVDSGWVHRVDPSYVRDA